MGWDVNGVIKYMSESPSHMVMSEWADKRTNIDQVHDLLQEIVLAVEEITPEHHPGESKHDLAMKVFNYLDKQLDKKGNTCREHLFKFLKKVPLVKWLPRRVKFKLIDRIIDFGIKQAVAVFNKTIWA